MLFYTVEQLLQSYFPGEEFFAQDHRHTEIHLILIFSSRFLLDSDVVGDTAAKIVRGEVGVDLLQYGVLDFRMLIQESEGVFEIAE